jgi:hypothetical protein
MAHLGEYKFKYLVSTHSNRESLLFKFSLKLRVAVLGADILQGTLSSIHCKLYVHPVQNYVNKKKIESCAKLWRTRKFLNWVSANFINLYRIDIRLLLKQIFLAI